MNRCRDILLKIFNGLVINDINQIGLSDGLVLLDGFVCQLDYDRLSIYITI